MHTPTSHRPHNNQQMLATKLWLKLLVLEEKKCTIPTRNTERRSFGKLFGKFISLGEYKSKRCRFVDEMRIKHKFLFAPNGCMWLWSTKFHVSTAWHESIRIISRALTCFFGFYFFIFVIISFFEHHQSPFFRCRCIFGIFQ